RRFIYPPTKRCDDSVDNGPDRLLTAEACLRFMKPASAFDVYILAGIHHDLTHVWIREQGFKRTQTHGLIHHLREQFLAINTSRQFLVVSENRGQCSGSFIP